MTKDPQALPYLPFTRPPALTGGDRQETSVIDADIIPTPSTAHQMPLGKGATGAAAGTGLGSGTTPGGALGTTGMGTAATGGASATAGTTGATGGAMAAGAGATGFGGPRPGISTGMHFAMRGLLTPNSFLVKSCLRPRRSALRLKSTSTPMLLAMLTPVRAVPGPHWPALLKPPVSVAVTSGSLTANAASNLAILMISSPKLILGWEKAVSVTPAEKAATSKRGVSWTLSKPTAVLFSGWRRSATNLALPGMLALMPYFIDALVVKAALAPTSYEMTAPSEKIPATEIPASGIGILNRFFEKDKLSGWSPPVIVEPSSRCALRFVGVPVSVTSLAERCLIYGTLVTKERED